MVCAFSQGIMQLKWDSSRYLRHTQIYYNRTYTDLMSNFSKMKQWELMLQKTKLLRSCINWYSSEKHTWEADNWVNNPYSRTASAVVGFFILQNSCDKLGKREKQVSTLKYRKYVTFQCFCMEDNIE